MQPNQSAAEAFGAFAQKLQRFISAGGERPATASHPRTAQEALNQALSEQKKAVITRYKSFLSPDQAIAKDQTELVAAYELFKAVQEANATHGTEATHLDGVPLVSPLSKADRYTIGGDFVYLQCWLCYERGITDYTPELCAHTDEVWRLQFVPARHHHPTREDNDKAAVIRSCFYPGR